MQLGRLSSPKICSQQDGDPGGLMIQVLVQKLEGLRSPTSQCVSLRMEAGKSDMPAQGRLEYFCSIQAFNSWDEAHPC